MRALSLSGACFLVLACGESKPPPTQTPTPEPSASISVPTAASTVPMTIADPPPNLAAPTASSAPPPAASPATPISPPATGPVKTADDAARRAAPAANAALSKSYARSKTSSFGAKEPNPWVIPDRAQVTGDAKRGFTVKWSSLPPAGFGIQAIVTVSGAGAVTVTKAEAAFSPD